MSQTFTVALMTKLTYLCVEPRLPYDAVFPRRDLTDPCQLSGRAPVLRPHPHRHADRHTHRSRLGTARHWASDSDRRGRRFRLLCPRAAGGNTARRPLTSPPGQPISSRRRRPPTNRRRASKTMGSRLSNGSDKCVGIVAGWLRGSDGRWPAARPAMAAGRGVADR